MAITTPSVALVRPRVLVKRNGESGLLEDIVSEIAAEFGTGLIRLTGGPGSGKTTALAHLAAVFAHDERFAFLDEPSAEELNDLSGQTVVVATMLPGEGHNMELALEPWGIDELIEYLLAAQHETCGAVIARLGSASKLRWVPEVACIVFDRFVADGSLASPEEAIAQHFRKTFSDAKQLDTVREHCLNVVAKRKKAAATLAKVRKHCPADVLKLLRHEMVQLPLATERVASRILDGDFGDLQECLPQQLIDLVVERCTNQPKMLNRLSKLLQSRHPDAAHAMAATIMHAADASWRPQKRGKRPWRLAGATFRDAHWPAIDLAGAVLSECDVSGAHLESGVLDGATLNGSLFESARLNGASLLRVIANETSFRASDLEQAKLANARLRNADFSEVNLTKAALMFADLRDSDLSSATLREASLSSATLIGATLRDTELSGADLWKADLSGLDLRRVCLDDACLEDANLSGVQMEDVRIRGAKLAGADLSGAYLTGSVLTSADLQRANLSGAGLADINWEGADLRRANLQGATFHMGSSRSGLVNSPIACEGSKTGFYTDDFDDMTFKNPEEVRKANLRGADLRGVNAAKVDFYLVDLREAKLDPSLLEQARQTGAILRDVAD